MSEQVTVTAVGDVPTVIVSSWHVPGTQEVLPELWFSTRTTGGLALWKT
jgi:hypothetical protein